MGKGNLDLGAELRLATGARRDILVAEDLVFVLHSKGFRKARNGVAIRAMQCGVRCLGCHAASEVVVARWLMD